MNRIRYFVGLAAIAILAGAASLAHAQNATSWNVTGPADWTIGGDWASGTLSTTAGAWFPGGSVINNGGTVNITTNVTDNSGNSTVLIGGSGWDLNGSGNGYVNMTAGTLHGGSTPMQEVLGIASGSGIFTQSGGINVPYANSGYANYYTTFSSLQLGWVNGGYGEYDMSGGSLGVNAIYVGGSAASQDVSALLMNAGTGVFNQTGGSVGSFVTPGVANKAIGLSVGGNWSSQSSVQHASSVGTYTLGNADGTPSATNGQYPLFVGGCEVIGASGTGTFTQNCGTNAIVGGGDCSVAPGGNSTPYNSAIGALLLGWYSGHEGVPTVGYFGNGVGTYNLNGGLLTGGPSTVALGGVEVVGVAGTGIFNQTAGTNQCTTELDVGGFRLTTIFNSIPDNASSGVYTLTNGLLTAGRENVGAAGTGIFTQTAGTNITTQLELAGWARTYTSFTAHAMNGTYNLNGGLFQATSIGLGDSAANGTIGAATFNFTGGTLQAGPGGLNVNIPIALAANSMCTLDMNGGTVNLTSLTTVSGLTDFNFADPTTGNDLLSVPNGGLSVNSNTLISFGKDPTAAGGPYELIADTTDTLNPANFTLPTAPAGVTYSLTQDGSGNIDLMVATVPEPGTLALLIAGLMSLLGFAWRRKKLTVVS